MAGFLSMMDKFTPIPWRGYLLLLAVSFLAASGVSTVLGYMLLPDGDGRGRVTRPTASATRAFQIPDQRESLTKPQLDTILQRNIFNSESPATDETKPDEDLKTPTEEVVK